MLKPFGKNIWTVDGGPIVAAAGFHYPTRMEVIKLTNGDLFIWSPVALSEALRSAILKLGPIAHIVAPNSLHHMYVPEWVDSFPEAKVYAAPGLREKRKDIKFDEDLDDKAPLAWAGDIDQVVITGNLITAEVVFYHRDSQTVFFTDFLQQLPKDWFSGWRHKVARLDFMLEDEPAVPRKFRTAMLNRKKARAAIRHILNWPIENVIMAHGDPVMGNGNTYLRRAFKWLKV